jgi:hypothetical protein
MNETYSKAWMSKPLSDKMIKLKRNYGNLSSLRFNFACGKFW